MYVKLLSVTSKTGIKIPCRWKILQGRSKEIYVQVNTYYNKCEEESSKKGRSMKCQGEVNLLNLRSSKKGAILPEKSLKSSMKMILVQIKLESRNFQSVRWLSASLTLQLKKAPVLAESSNLPTLSAPL